jgi:hypothetical protein
MGNFDIVQPLNQPGDHPADIMAKISHVSAFLCTMVDGDHVKPDGALALHPDAVSGLAHILGFIHSASAAAAAATTEELGRNLVAPRAQNELNINGGEPMKKAC